MTTSIVRTRTKNTTLGKQAKVAIFFGALATACIGTTGSELVTFEAFAAGPGDIPTDAPARGLAFARRGWSITLTRAKVHIGALYLNRSVPVSGGQERDCFLPGVYVAQVLSGMDLDALSPVPQPFPDRGSGTADLAVTGEVWLTGGSIDALDDRTIIADIAGTATRDATTMRFEGTVTIGKNRLRSDGTDPARPGANPLCGERIVTQIATSIRPTNGGKLLVRVDPREWFDNVELGDLEPVSPTSDLRVIPDDASNQPAANLYGGLRARDTYRFEWLP